MIWAANKKLCHSLFRVSKWIYGWESCCWASNLRLPWLDYFQPLASLFWKGGGGGGVTPAKLKHRMYLVYFFIITPSPPSSFPSDKLSFPSFPKLWLLELEQPAKQEKNFIDAYSPHQMTFSLWIIIIDIIISSALPPRWYTIGNFHLAAFVRLMEQISLWNFLRR